MQHLYATTSRPVLIGAWRAAGWALEFYRKHGFSLVGEEEKTALLATYWNVPRRQVDESVVLVDERWLERSRGSWNPPRSADVSPDERIHSNSAM